MFAPIVLCSTYIQLVRQAATSGNAFFFIVLLFPFIFSLYCVIRKIICKKKKIQTNPCLWMAICCKWIEKSNNYVLQDRTIAFVGLGILKYWFFTSQCVSYRIGYFPSFRSWIFHYLFSHVYYLLSYLFLF